MVVKFYNKNFYSCTDYLVIRIVICTFVRLKYLYYEKG